MPKGDPHIFRAAVLSAPCKACRRRTDELGDAHLVDREFYCQDCCPKCKKKTKADA